MKKLLLSLLLAGCAPSVNVPATVETTQCIQKSDGSCTSELEVRHVITVELPTILTDNCKKIWNEIDYPDQATRDAGYNSCVSEYINSLLELIRGIKPADLPSAL